MVIIRRYRSVDSPAVVSARPQGAVVNLDNAAGGVSNTPPQNATGVDQGGAVARLWAARVDALTVAFRVVTTDERLSELEAARQLAKESPGGQVAFCVGVGRCSHPLWLSLDRWTFAVDKRAPSNGYAVRLSNADATVLVMGRHLEDQHGAPVGPDWNVEVTLRASYLATHTMGEAVELARELARRASGGDGWLYSERVRRVDLAADADPGLRSFSVDDRGAFVGRPKRATDYVPGEDATQTWTVGGVESRTHWAKTRDTQITGFSFAMGAPLSARLYDKLEELKRYPAEHEKHHVERAQWTASGWSGEPVWRLEFQFRREALEGVIWHDGERSRTGVHTLDDLLHTLDALWRYATTSWLRCVERDSATRAHRATLDARWLAYQAAKFGGKPIMVKRTKLKKGGADAAQTRGCILSTLASEGRLPTLAPHDAASVQDDARRAVEADLLALRETLLERLQTDDEARAYLAQRDALEARFSHCTGAIRPPEPEPTTALERGRARGRAGSQRLPS